MINSKPYNALAEMLAYERQSLRDGNHPWQTARQDESVDKTKKPGGEASEADQRRDPRDE